MVAASPLRTRTLDVAVAPENIRHLQHWPWHGKPLHVGNKIKKDIDALAFEELRKEAIARDATYLMHDSRTTDLEFTAGLEPHYSACPYGEW